MLKKLLVILFCIVSFQLTKCDKLTIPAGEPSGPSEPTGVYPIAGKWMTLRQIPIIPAIPAGTDFALSSEGKGKVIYLSSDNIITVDFTVVEILDQNVVTALMQVQGSTDMFFMKIRQKVEGLMEMGAVFRTQDEAKNDKTPMTNVLAFIKEVE